jgi:hypothetical protein
MTKNHNRDKRNSMSGDKYSKSGEEVSQKLIRSVGAAASDICRYQ